ncbi:MAG TPA: (d)CMP kinase [Halanaerobiales bacterium]|nr:(d)CMP kinase [Halanaerobiales bacterium]
MCKIIAIDGPAGAGKSTIAQLIAKILSYKYIDSGAMYRAVTWLALKEKIGLDNIKELIRIASEAEINFLPVNRDGISNILLNGHDITAGIRDEIIDKNVSEIAMIKGIREEMLKKQRKLAKIGGIVMDGRDIGSRVFPDADFKFYITASLKERTRRRYNDLKNRGINLNIDNIMQQIKKRDKLDMDRKHSPLIITDDAILIDTTDLSITEAVNNIIKIIDKG